MESLSNWLFKMCSICFSMYHMFIFGCCYSPLVVFSKKTAISESLTVSQQLAMLEQMLSRQQLNANSERVVCLTEVCCMWAFQTQVQCWISGENFKAKPLSFGSSTWTLSSQYKAGHPQAKALQLLLLGSVDL